METQNNIQEVIDKIAEQITYHYGRGKVATYIPKLAGVMPNQFAMSVVDSKGQFYCTGEHTTKFSIQSVSKVFLLTLVLNNLDQEIWGRMDREPSGKAFDSLIHLEETSGIPSNPFLNSGAIVMVDMLMDIFGKNTFDEVLKFIKVCSGNDELSFDHEIYLSEKESGHKNNAFCSYMKAYGNITHEVEDVLDNYYKICSISMHNSDLAKSFYYLSNRGITLAGEVITTQRHTKRINSIMFTCGTYNEVGDFAYLVGLPVKSGVSGAIAGCLPHNYAISVWAPELNEKGNSYLGFKALEEFTTVIDKSYLD